MRPFLKRTVRSRALSALCSGVVASVVLLASSAVAAPEPPGSQRVGTIRLPPEVKTAIDRGLESLAQSQDPREGCFGMSGHPVADTSVGLMAFLLQGHVPGRGKYGEVMDKAVAYLLKVYKINGKTGYLGVGNMYEHGLSTLALSEVWGQSKNPEIREALIKAVDVILRAQSKNGGWRYSPKPGDHDISVTVMQVVALNSAKEAGVAVPDASLKKAVQYARSCFHHDSGGFNYQPGSGGPKLPRSAGGVMALIMAGARDSREVIRGIEYLRSKSQSFASAPGDRLMYYAHYYAMQAMYQMGDRYFKMWYDIVAPAMLAAQRPNGAWGDGYVTGTAILVLGTPYRYLPIYQR